MMQWIRFLMMTICLAGSAGAYAVEGSGLSRGSELSAEGTSALVAGSVEVIAGSPTLTVQAVNAAAEGAVVVLNGASTAAKVSIQVTPEIAGALSKAVGATVEVATEASGYALIYAGKMIAFIPNAAGQKLLHHAPHPQ
jgi:hypothetical protein